MEKRFVASQSLLFEVLVVSSPLSVPLDIAYRRNPFYLRSWLFLDRANKYEYDPTSRNPFYLRSWLFLVKRNNSDATQSMSQSLLFEVLVVSLTVKAVKK